MNEPFTTIDRDISGRTAFTLLTELILAAQQGKDFYRQLGISREAFNNLCSLNIAELSSVARNPILRLSVDERVLNLAIQGVLARRNRDDLLKQAMLHGASRSVMARYANMSYNAFNKQRNELGIEEIRSRPVRLSDREYDDLIEAHRYYGSTHSLHHKGDHLRCLLFLSERCNIDINRVFWYYYSDNEHLFTGQKIQTASPNDAEVTTYA
ncbi:STY4526/YPO1902 family pathogenicity island replication protein [Cardiobacterium valvarum]|jgi:hypothetical protein|uniref:Protein of uncharacterized function (DUF2857) n=1 Tax=Cardiobacterium valvarum TaxID=194702 RepID=A0A381E7G1_9GAMM|nr:STY4526/YPO1902 family pathogenicity island replication protein [Cardiobacterium valvarum]SUX22641.1 Protein of uncharacterised function (DUF2857) [Cardiobacterium valvarum]